jgi:hypothetical protein
LCGVREVEVVVVDLIQDSRIYEAVFVVLISRVSVVLHDGITIAALQKRD